MRHPLQFDAHKVLLEGADRKQITRILEEGDGDIEPSFMGFFDAYYALSMVVPKGRTVYDLGCSHGAQAFFFRDHKGYVGVDCNNVNRRYQQTNVQHIQADLYEWIKRPGEPVQPSFAIFNYVPVSLEPDLSRRFPHHFVFYPQRGDNPELDEVFDSLRGPFRRRP